MLWLIIFVNFINDLQDELENVCEMYAEDRKIISDLEKVQNSKFQAGILLKFKIGV